MANRFTISVIIATKDRHHVILDCLLSIYRQTYLPFEIIIVDSSSNNKTKDELKKVADQYLKPIHIHRTEQGSSTQRNIGARIATGDLVAFLDDDVVLHPDFFEKLVPLFAEKDIGGATGRIINENLSRWSLLNTFRFLTFFSYPAYGQLRISGFHTEYNWYDKPLEVEWLSGAACIYQREVFSEFLFDEKLKGYAYNEDLDLSYRISRKYKCLYIPDARYVHNKSESRLSAKIAKQVVVNNRYLLRKNILPNKSATMKLLHLLTFYIAIFSFLTFLLITGRFKILKGGIMGLGKRVE